MLYWYLSKLTLTRLGKASTRKESKRVKFYENVVVDKVKDAEIYVRKIRSDSSTSIHISGFGRPKKKTPKESQKTGPDSAKKGLLCVWGGAKQRP